MGRRAWNKFFSFSHILTFVNPCPRQSCGPDIHISWRNNERILLKERNNELIIKNMMKIINGFRIIEEGQNSE